jgi:hypothetical protein
LAQRLARNKFRPALKARAANDTPPGDATTAKLRTAVQQLRQTAHGDATTLAICSEAERLIDSGWIERRGGGERTKPVPLPKELKPYAAQWEKPPPERDER